MKLIELKTPSISGKIYVGEEVAEARLPFLTKGQTNFVVTDSNVYALYADWFSRYFSGAEIFVLPAGEENKNFQSLYEILEKMSQSGLQRTSRLFAVGGGVVGDIGGLAAALYMRGISCVQIPTTLLAQVDSSVGGKTAVDLGGVKNIVGAFFQTCEVLVDPGFLKTLPPREIKCGLGEVVKYAALNGEIFDTLTNAQDLTDIDFLTGLIEACIRHKAGVVERDEKESGERKSLNVGHTTGHAIELYFGLSHGESVLHGMRLETQMAMQAKVCEKGYGEALLALIDKALAVAPVAELEYSKLKNCANKARSDKKNTQADKIVMAVASEKGKWSEHVLPFADYEKALGGAVNNRD